MNQSLVDPFILAQDIPDTLTAKLRSSGASVCIRFSRQGDYLASGTSKGTIAIFDLETIGVARKLRGHTPGRQVQSLSWSSTGRYLLSSSVDWQCILWDLYDGSRVRAVNFGAPVFNAELHPHNHYECVAALFEDRPVIADMSDESTEIRGLSSGPKQAIAEQGDHNVEHDAKHYTSTAVFTPSGQHIISGTNKGWMNVMETQTGKIIYSTRLSPKALLLLRISASGRDLVVNSADTIIRTLTIPDFADPRLDIDGIGLEVEHKFQDVVNRLSWNHVAFSATGDHVLASTMMNHDVYIWERRHGSLVKILECPKEELGAVEWHPHKPLVAATGVESGKIYIWQVNTPQRWSALAPDFAEVEENVEYVEREDEFDIQPLEELHKRRLDREDDDVDVLTIDQLKPGQGGGPDEFRLPVLFDLYASDSEDDMVAVGTGQFRRKNGDVKETQSDDGEPASESESAAGEVTNDHSQGRAAKRRRNE